MNPQQAEQSIEVVSAGTRMLQAVKDNQLLTAAAIFILWQFDLFNSVVGMAGCGL